MHRLLISAAHKSSGKTTLSVGLCAALRALGQRVQPFKKGPDYIDPMWLSRAAGRPCLNLDAFLMDDAALETCFVDAMRAEGGADLAIVEGNKGLYDGLALDGSNSNAALAHRLGLPVLLVIDARGMTRGIAPLILGYQAFDRHIRIGGVILNRVGGSRHEAKLRAVIEHYTDVPVLGAVAEDQRLAVLERHLGLVPCAELGDAQERIGAIGAIVAAQVDLQRVLAMAASADASPASAAGRSATAPFAPAQPSLRAPAPGAGAAAACAPRRSAVARAPTSAGAAVRIAIARDRAFGFYYPDDLAALQAAGAELVQIDTLHDTQLPAVDGLFIGGGFPEACMDELEANVTLRIALREAIEDGLPAYAECGGLMYLSRSIAWRGRTAMMVGAIPGDTVMHERPIGRGYVQLQETSAMPWRGPSPAELRGHEFHHSSLENLEPGVDFAYRVRRGHGVNGTHDGVLVHNLLASYAHLRSAAGSLWAPRFVAFVAARRAGAQRERAAALQAGAAQAGAALTAL
jgi:cobyrinic acid a,c-diamide synthase